MKKHSSSGQEEAVDAAAQANEPPRRSVCTEGAVDLPLLQTNTFPKDLDHRDVSASLKSCTDEQPNALASSGGLQAAAAPVPFVPFSGGGQCLGESPAAAAVPVSDMPSSKLPTSLCSPGGPSKPKKTKTSQGQPKEHEQVRGALFVCGVRSWLGSAFLSLCFAENRSSAKRDLPVPSVVCPIT